MRTLHLFAGAGGSLYAGLILGWTNIAAVEYMPFRCAVLRARAADGWFPGLVVHECDITKWNPEEYAGRVDCIAAGWPCQDLSCAGKHAGITGARSGLWSEIVRIAGVIRPRVLFLENSPMLVSTGAVGRVVGDLAGLGYGIRWGIVRASDSGAWHARARWFGLAYLGGVGFALRTDADIRGWKPVVGESCSDDADPAGHGREAQRAGDEPQGRVDPGAGWWDAEPSVVRVVHGLADRCNRVAALGDGWVPAQAALAWWMLGGPVK